ncbi:MAG TPA: hypothetical protein GX708_16170, partial [Gallicola sp.]|nr:hypothetical protein [Gallicola sp.]
FEVAINKTLELINAQNFNCTIDNYIQAVIKQIQNKKWVTNWILSIIADYDKDNNTNYYQEGLKVREDIKAIRNKEYQERREKIQKEQEQKEKELAEQKRIEQEEKARENFCNGFTDKLSPMQQQKVANVLNKWYRYDNGVMQRKDNVLVRLRDGWLPKIQEEVKIKLDDNERYGYKEVSKEVYSLSKDNLYLEITKTEYDYANYLINVLGLENAKLSSENK